MITQSEMLEKVFVPLRAQLSLQSYQLMVIQYIQSLTRAQIPVRPEL